ncbi:MAG: hypothetical protein ACREHF_02880 [Rhizomicrobium sp.]
MNKTVLLAAAAAFALTAGGAFAAPAPSVGVHGAKITPVIHHVPGLKMLYNQNSNNSGVGLVSQNFSATDSAYDDTGADDFVVPAGSKWKVKEVDVTGVYFNGSAPATSENVTFYKDKKGMPGKVVKAETNLKGKDTAGSFTIKLSKTVRLRPGTYWVGVVANKNFGGGGGEWGWELNSTIHGKPAMWENPNGGFGVCPTWGTVGSCLGYTGDFMFDLQGKG